METFLIISSILSVLAQVASSYYQSQQETQNLKESRDYNSITNQVDQYRLAGLNPNLAAGNFVPVGTNVSNVSSPASGALRGLSSSLMDVMNVYGKNEQRDINRENAETNRINSDTNRMKAWMENKRLSLWEKQVKQALRRGQIGYAMDLLNFDILSTTKDAKINKALAEANIISNKSLMSDYEAKTYSDYRDAIIDDVISRSNRTNYLNYRDSQKLANDYAIAKSNLRLKAQNLFDDRAYRKGILGLRSEHEQTYIDSIDEKNADDRRDFITHLIERGIDIGLAFGSRGRKMPRYSPRRGISPNYKF